MSFYVGKYNGKPLCHITKGSHDINKMKGEPFKETVFHTDINYLDYKIFPLENNYSKTTTMYNIQYNHNGSFVIYEGRPVNLYTITGELWDYVYTTPHFFILYDNDANEIYQDKSFYNAVFIDEYSTRTQLSSSSWKWTANTIDIMKSKGYYARRLLSNCETTSDQTNYKIRNVAYDGPRAYANKLVLDSTKNISVIVFGCKIDGSISPIQNLNFNGQISLTKNQFKIGNVDLTNMRYVIPGSINNTDTILINSQTGDNFQLINSTPKNNNIDVVTNKLESYIAKGSSKLITSNIGSSMVDIIATASYAIPVIYGQIKDNSISHNEVISTINTFTGEKMLFIGFAKNPSLDETGCRYSYNEDNSNIELLPISDTLGNYGGVLTRYTEGRILTLAAHSNSTQTTDEYLYGNNGKIYYQYSFSTTGTTIYRNSCMYELKISILS